MTLQFNMVALLLVFLIVLGLISQNSAITIISRCAINYAANLIIQIHSYTRTIRCQNRDYHFNDWCPSAVSVGKNPTARSQFIFKLENGRVDCNGNIRRMACGERGAINE